MPWTQKQMLRDANGDLIPQYWDVVEQDFKPLTGQGGANDVRLTGSIVELFEVENILVPAHSAVYVTSSMKYPTTNFAVAFTFSPWSLRGGFLLKFFERIGSSLATEFNIVDGDELKTYRGTASFKSVIPEGNIRVDNLSGEDITLVHIKVWGIL